MNACGQRRRGSDDLDAGSGWLLRTGYAGLTRLTGDGRASIRTRADLTSATRHGTDEPPAGFEQQEACFKERPLLLTTIVHRRRSYRRKALRDRLLAEWLAGRWRRRAYFISALQTRISGGMRAAMAAGWRAA